MLKRILVALDGSAFSKTSVDYACQIAKAQKAQLTGIAVIDLPDIEKSIGPVPLGATYYAERIEHRKVEEAKQQARAILKDFTQTCKQRRVQGRALAKEGQPFKVIIEESKYHDLVILGLKTFFRHGVMKEPGDTLEKLLKQGIKPALAVPEAYRPIQRILIAYDGSIQAAKAAQQFLQSELWKNRKVTLLNVNDDAAKGEALLRKLGEYFKSYGIASTKLCRSGDPAEGILNYAAESKADLLVIGAYGKESVLGFFFGSVTKKILHQAILPLFIYH